MTELGPLGPILGSNACAHATVSYYRGVEGVYAVCHECRGHFWDAVVPAGAEVVDLMAFDDEAPDECEHGVSFNEDCADCEEETREYGRGG